MTLADRDPAPAIPWRPHSSKWARRMALQACAEAVRGAREKRTNTPTTNNPDVGQSVQ